jgi:hypothetical protein
MFAYELPLATTSKLHKENLNLSMKNYVQPSVVVYNFHSMFFHNRIFIFSHHNQLVFNKNIQSSYYTLNSIAELFPAGN